MSFCVRRLKPPTANELVEAPPHGLDEKWALKNFLGKTQEQTVEMCKGSAVTEDFTYVASAGLCYYLPAALRYLESEEAAHHWEFAHGLMCARVVHAGVATVGVSPRCAGDGRRIPWKRAPVSILTVDYCLLITPTSGPERLRSVIISRIASVPTATFRAMIPCSSIR